MERDSKGMADKAAQELERIEQVNDLLKTYFSKFDERIINTMRKYIFLESGMRQLFKKLNLSFPASLNQQLEAVAKFISISGEAEFRKRILYTDSDSKFAIKPIIYVDKPSPLLQGASVSTPAKEQTQPKQTPSAMQEIQTPSAQPPKPQANILSTPVAPIQPPPASIPSPAEEKVDPAKLTWPYVDRRSGKDRRTKQDRRSQVDVIFKNKRYGGERRSGIERRKNWPPPKDKK